MSVQSAYKNSRPGPLLRLAAAAGLAFFLALSPAQGHAACEADGAAAAAAVSGISNDIDAMIVAIKNSWKMDLNTLRARLGLMNRDFILNKLDQFWLRWSNAWHKEAAQLGAGIDDQSRQLSAIKDASNVMAAGIEEQKQRIKAKSLYQPTEQACRFDTTAPYMTTSRALSRALENGFEWDFAKKGNNQGGSLAEAGPGELQRHLWNRYKNKFCDYRAENSSDQHDNAGCPGPTLKPAANMDALPSSLLFSRPTLDMSNQDVRDALDQMMHNITGYVVPEPLIPGAFSSVAGAEELLRRRKYIARMSTVGSLLYSTIADRAPIGQQAHDVRNLRAHLGAPASSAVGGASLTPSKREIRQSIVEQLWDPNYYKDLYDSPSTIAQKEVYLKAYSLVLLYDLIAKQERISNVYAVETATILERKLKNSLNSAVGSAPLTHE
jgi:hypothetical protein